MCLKKSAQEEESSLESELWHNIATARKCYNLAFEDKDGTLEVSVTFLPKVVIFTGFRCMLKYTDQPQL